MCSSEVDMIRAGGVIDHSLPVEHDTVEYIQQTPGMKLPFYRYHSAPNGNCSLPPSPRIMPVNRGWGGRHSRLALFWHWTGMYDMLSLMIPGLRTRIWVRPQAAEQTAGVYKAILLHLCCLVFIRIARIELLCCLWILTR